MRRHRGEPQPLGITYWAMPELKEGDPSMDGGMEGWMDGGMEGWMDGGMYGGK